MNMEQELHAVQAENVRLRAALAQSDQPCAYCSLPRDEWTKCPVGFPGCARSDDAMGCPELGARLRAEQLEAEIVRLREVGRKYGELLYHVQNKYPDESRHDTALRYIRERVDTLHQAVQEQSVPRGTSD